MVRPDRSDIPPDIELRIPSPWGSSEQLRDALDKAKSDYAWRDGKLVHRKTGWSCECLGSPHDDDLVEMFAHGERRLSFKELKEIDSHVSKVHLVGPGGSPEAARAMMQAAAAIVNAGAFAVFVDNSGLAHGKSDWLKLAGDKQPGGVYWAYVATTRDSDGTLYTIGMHCLGFRDAELPDAPDDEAGYFLLHNFLGYSYRSGIEIKDGDPCGDEAKPLFRVRHQLCMRVPRGTPFFNPYGVWRLEPIVEDEEDDEEAGDAGNAGDAD